MADQSISQLTQLDGASLAAGDLLPIVDTSSTQTKKITASDLIQNGIALTASGNIDLGKLNQSSVTKLGTTAIADDAITAAKLANNSSIAVAAAAPSGDNFTGRGWLNSSTNVLSIYSSGNYQEISVSIASGVVTTDKIAANAVTTAKIEASGLGTAAIADGAITTVKLAASGVTGAKIASGTITNDNIALNTIDATRIAAGAIGTDELASLAVTSAKIANGAVGTSALADGGVTNDKIANATITYAKLNVADGSIPGSKITATSISGAQITTGGIGTTNLADGSITNAKIASSTIGIGKFAAGAIATADIANDAITIDKIADNAVNSAQLVDSGVTGVKLAANSSTVVAANAPTGNGAFTGQQWFDSSTGFEYTWNGASWTRQSALNSLSFSDSTPIAFAVSYPDSFSATVTTTLDNQSPNAVFIGPASGAAAAPTFRTLQAVDLPLATTGSVGVVQAGAGLSVDGTGALNHSNSAIAGTYAGPVTIDAQGHVTSAQTTLQASDIPNLDASKITTGTFSSTFLADNSVTASQLADYGIAQVSESAPVPEFAGQWWVNPNDRAAYIWVGEVTPVPNGYWLSLGYGSPTQINLRFGGTYNASGNVVESINSYGIEAGLTVGQGLASPNTSNNGLYLIVTTSGVGTTPAPAENLSVGNWVLSQGTGASWTKVSLGSAVAGVADQDVLVAGPSLTPPASGIASQEDFNNNVWPKVQIATSGSTGIVRASSELLVASGTGIMTIGTIDDGNY